MTHQFIKKISQSRLVLWLLGTPAPRWLVLLIDLAIVAVNCLMTFRFNASVVGNSLSEIATLGIILATYFVFSFIFRSFQYVIRLSAIEDLVRVIVLCGASTVTLFLISLISEATNGIEFIREWNALTIGVFSFAMMMSLRVVLRYLFIVFSSSRRAKIPTIILGSSFTSFTLAEALKSETDGRYAPVAVLSLDEKVIKSNVYGLPVIKYESDKIAEIFKKHNCKTLVFNQRQITLMREGMADAFLANGIKLMLFSELEEFDVESAGNTSHVTSHMRDIKIEDLLGRTPIKNDNPAIKRQINGQVVMITGAAGSIGSEIVRQTAQLGAKEIVLVDQAETPMHEMQLEMDELYPNVRIHLFVGDITNKDRMERAFEKYHPRLVYHAAAYKHVPMMERNPPEAVMTNVFGTKNLADLALKYGVEKFVMISTDKAVNPTNIMGATKRIAEIYVQSLFFFASENDDRPVTQFITTRFGNVLGSNGSVIPRFRQQIESGGPVTVTHRDIIRYFMTIPEACSLVLEAGCMGHGGEIYIFDMGCPIKIYDLATRMISLAGLRPGVDIEVVETGLRPGEKLYEELLNDKERTRSTQHDRIMIAKVNTYPFGNVIKQINKLHDLAFNRNHTHDMVALMKMIVPEFHSQNSIYEAIDQEIESEANPKSQN